MKNNILYFFALMLCAQFIMAQRDTTRRKYRQELGSDAVGFVTQFLNSKFVSDPPYLVTYRFYFPGFNLRAGLGGNFQQNTSATYSISGNLAEFTSTAKVVNLRVGIERVEELGKRWQAFYGVDVRATLNTSDNPASYLDFGYITGSAVNSTSFGLAPLMGLRFRISDRVSLLTETSLWIFYQQTVSTLSYISTDPLVFPNPPESTSQTAKSYQTRFYQPSALFLVVSF